uniref:Uncharacterized protein n=1 Tax=Amphimedon queenslandica TaxID=400682 RepID=A0A1X7V430_AMPQE
MRATFNALYWSVDGGLMMTLRTSVAVSGAKEQTT